MIICRAHLVPELMVDAMREPIESWVRMKNGDEVKRIEPRSKGAELSLAINRPSDWMFLQPGILDLMHEAVTITNMQGMITGCNQAARRIFGCSQEELTGQNVVSFYAEEDRHIFEDRLLPAVLSTGAFKGELRNRSKCGDYSYIHLSVGVLRDEAGKPVGMVGFSVDITAQKLGDLAVRRNDEIEQELEAKREDSAFLRTLERAVERSDVVIKEQAKLTRWFATRRDTTEQSETQKQPVTSKARMRTVMEAIPQFLWTADSQGRRDWVSKTFATFVGASANDCLGDGWVRYVHPDDRDKALRQLELDGKLHRISTVELRLRGRDGEYVWFLKQAAPRVDAAGAVVGWVGSFTNISERMSAEVALKDAEERAQLGMAVAKLALADIDYSTGINHLSTEAARMFGLGEERLSVPREVVHGTFHPDDLPELKRRMDACLNPNGAGWFDMDHRVVWPTGEIRWLRVRKQVFFEGEGRERRPSRALLAAFDVTEPKRAEAEVRESEKRFRDLAESLPQFVFVTDGKGEKIYCNRGYLDYVGALSYRALHSEWHLSIHPEEREATVEAWKLSLSSGAAYLQEFRLRRYDGEYRHVLARGIAVRNEAGEIERWLGSMTDVHDRKLAEDTLRRTEKLAVVGRMASSISHEINNPLAGLVNLLYLIDTSPEMPQHLRGMLESAQELLARVTEVTTRTLLFHRQSTKQSAMRLSDTVDSLLALHKPLVELKQTVVTRKDRRIRDLWCYAGEVRQAVAHIINNSLDALGVKGKLVVSVRESSSWRSPLERGVRLTIADSGRGIQEQDLPFVFDAFFTTKGLNGTGLGLWISKEIIERHEGFIRLKSSARVNNSGTVIHVFLPYHSTFQTLSAGL